MKNPYLTTVVKIKDIKLESPDVKLFTLKFVDKEEEKKFNPLPGQIVEIGLLGFGEGPFVVCSWGFEKKFFQISVRNVGKLTNKLHSLKIGDVISMRGPYGFGVFPETDRNLLLIAGGIGLVPLRPLIQRKIRNSGGTGGGKNENKIQLFYGVKEKNELIFQDEYEEWKKHIDIYITLDKPCTGWKGNVGLITTLFSKAKINDNPVAILCGPPVMYRFVIDELHKMNIKDEDIYISLERRIHCGIGLCQHCAVGSKYICKDGPVFKYSEVKDINGII